MAKKKIKPGPNPETLKIESDWEKVVKKAFEIQRPKGGWPDPDNRQKAKPDKPKKRSR